MIHYDKTYVVERDRWGKMTIFEDRQSDKSWDEAEAVFHQIKSHPKTAIRVSHNKERLL